MKEIYLGNSKFQLTSKEVKGQFVEINGEKFYCISHFNEMPDFFMTIVSDSDHWMYLSSNGSLSAGRKDRDNALFPYYTVDKIHDYKGLTGSRTFCRVKSSGKEILWEPFTDLSADIYDISRNVYKSIYGNKIVFEEVNHDLELTFKYAWFNSEKFGWIRKSFLSNESKAEQSIEILDGIQNLLPAGVDYQFQSEYSNLADAYKKNELLPESRLGIYMLSSIPVDKAEPSESLRATTVWSEGVSENSKILISGHQIKSFKAGKELKSEIDIRASKGAYFINQSLQLQQGESTEWYIISETKQDSSDVSDLDHFIKSTSNKSDQLEKDIADGTANLLKKVASADGMQLTGDELCYARHFSNTLFNIMRGGIFSNNYTVDKKDFLLFVKQSNKTIHATFSETWKKLPGKISYDELVSIAAEEGNPDLERICAEYLPLTFSRRHGDPSRPWNQFSIELKNPDGSDKLNYQGNWRDIFQNWEALAVSFPGFIEGMISRFLNASTADGYNPYRITREGIDWESPDPEDPWAYIGYWGDHQIIYLQKLLEQSYEYHPGKLEEWLTKDAFVFAHVPYRIKTFEEILADPQDTIVFDHKLNESLQAIADNLGADGKLLTKPDGSFCRANLLEKILVSLLAKLSNFIPEAGIWLNTQRPEWNDANNALVGSGVSMVTLYYIRRFLKFWSKVFENTSIENVLVSEEVAQHFQKTHSIFDKHRGQVEDGFTGKDRYIIARELGIAGSEYRETIYNSAFSGQRSSLTIKELQQFIDVTLSYIEQSIQKNKREDSLYHAYNLISFENKEIDIRHLYEMLEGQVAVLSSGFLSPGESLSVLDGLKNSNLFRVDQFSYILYPDRQLPRFTEKNNIPDAKVKASSLLQTLVAEGNTSIVKKDKSGRYHFNSDFRNASLLEEALDELDNKAYGSLIDKEKPQILKIYEEVFDHQSFTGRSGTFYGYEGLGSIYWHMVSKLLLAAQECFYKAVEEKADPIIIGKLKEHYYEIKAGIGIYKSPDLYGAFPTDAYSHSPGNAGVKQPGLTGQVKEDFLSRFGELGVKVSDGEMHFQTRLFNPEEILKQEDRFSYVDIAGDAHSIDLQKNQIGFTFCQVPVIYTFDQKEEIRIMFADGKSKTVAGNSISKDISSKIFKRSGEISSIHCEIKVI